MKKWMLALLLFLVCVVQASQVLLEDCFTAAAPAIWKRVNLYEPFSAIEYTANGMVMKRNEKQQPIPGRLFDTAFELHSVPKQIPAGADYFDFSVKVGTNKATFMPLGFRESYQNRIVWYGKDGKKIGEYPYMPQFTFRLELPGWSSFRGDIPAGAAFAEVQFGFDVPNFQQGESAILCGVKLVVGTKEEIASMPSLGCLDHRATLASRSPTDDGTAAIVIEVANPASVDWANTTVTIDEKPIGTKLKRIGGKLTYTPAAPLADGLHIIRLAIRDIGGNIIQEYCPIYIGKMSTPNRMTVREDGMAMLNGKPFFLLGIACLVKQGRNGHSYDKAFEEAAAAGLNFARHWSSYNMEWKDAEEYLTAAKKHNMYISMSPTNVKNDIDIERLAKGVAAQIGLERVLVWDIGDDTSSWVTADDQIAKQKAIRAVDDSRLTTQGDSLSVPGAETDVVSKSRYTAYVKGSDTFQPEIYPIGHCEPGKETPEMTARWVPMVIKNMKQIHHDWETNGVSPRPVWPLIQYFHYKATGNHWNRMPTREELRAMSYLAVIHGAHGVFWYRYAGYRDTPNEQRGYSDEQWKIFSGITMEFRALYDMYCTLPVPQTQKACVVSGPAKDGLGYDSINTLLKRHDGKAYLIVCNSAMADVKARFTVPGVKSAKEYYEKRELTVSDGAFEDAFGPFGVHVYVME